MEAEDCTVIDVEVQSIDSRLRESIDLWYSGTQMQRMLNLNKSALQKVITKLTSIYAIDIKILRRGGARATEYSQVALDAIELLNARKFAELRNLAENSAPPATCSADSSTAIVFLDSHRQVAATAATVADSNLAEISSLKSNLLSNYRQLGRVLGQQAAQEVRMGFTEELKSGLANLQES